MDSVAHSEPLAQRGLRAAELAQLIDWLEAPHGSVALIQGRRGVGKDRLAEDLIRHAHTLPKTVVLEGRTPHAGGRSFHPYAEIAHQVMVWAEQHGLTERLIDPLYADLSPVLDHFAPDASVDTSVDQKLRFFDSFRTLLAGLAAWARPLVVVRDLERADSDTLELTSYLADELFADPALDPGATQPGLLVLLARHDDGTPTSARDTVAGLAGDRTTRTLELKGLDLDGLKRYVQAPHVLEKLLAASDGLPQELDAIFEALPTNVEELFERRLAGFDNLTQECLRALAVSGRPAAARTLATAIQQPVKRVAQVLNRLRDDKIVDRRISKRRVSVQFRSPPRPRSRGPHAIRAGSPSPAPRVGRCAGEGARSRRARSAGASPASIVRAATRGGTRHSSGRNVRRGRRAECGGRHARKRPTVRAR